MNSFETLNKLSAEELNLIFQNESHLNRDDAFYVLVNRFKEDLLKICEIRCKRFGQSIDVAIELVENVFSAYAKKPAFSFENAKSDDDYNAFLGYLCGIARNELTNIYRIQKRKKDGKWSDGSEAIITDLPKFQNGASLKSKVIYQVISELPYSHRVIYCTYSSYERIGSNLPTKLTSELREHLGLKQNTIRTYKKEALDRIKLALMGLEIIEEEAK